jgi:hypothetical protein
LAGAYNGVAFFLAQKFDNHIFRRNNTAFARPDQEDVELILLNIYFYFMRQWITRY